MNILNEFEDLAKKLLSTIILYIAILLIFSAIYQLINFYEGNSFKGGISTTLDYVYFSTVTMTTLGFGEITPITDLAKIIVIFQSLIGIFMLSILIGLTINISDKIDKKT